jgi:tRNA(Ile)-lysidine synthase
MIQLLGSTKHFTAVAVSGGVDSMAALDFLRRANPAIKAVYFHHGTAHGDDALAFLRDFCSQNAIPLLTGRISCEKAKEDSWEEYWRRERYRYLNSLPGKIVTAHHLNDAAESWVMGIIRGGEPRLIRYHLAPNIYRPLLLTPRVELEAWCQRHQVPWIQDPSNNDVSYDRNRIRHRILPEMLAINPGFLKQVAKKTKSAIPLNMLL